MFLKQLLTNKVAEECREEKALLVSEIEKATKFVKLIEAGKLDEAGDADVAMHSELMDALTGMRNRMKEIAAEESERKWTTEGLAKFADILRSGDDNLENLCNSLLSNLVKYLGANQGALFIAEKENDETVLVLRACYAYNKKKFINKKIAIGEGLAGQTFLEKDTIFLTEIPENYISITSGLGDSLPRNVVLVPLLLNEAVYGVLELASFSVIQPFQIKFLEKIGESIASSVSAVKVTEHTKKLLEDSQVQTEQLRAQEEEMRQNMEELAATQEDMKRVMEEVKDKEVYMNNLINATDDAILTVDTELKVVTFNSFLYNTFKANGIEVKPGVSVFSLSDPSNHAADKEIYMRVLTAGESHVKLSEYFGKVYEIKAMPIKDAAGIITGACVFTRDITESTLLQKQNEEILNTEKVRSEKVRRNREVLTRLTKSENLQNGHLDLALNELTMAMAEVFGVSRAAIWSYNAKKESIVLEKQYRINEDKFEAGMELFKKDIPVYFKSVEDEEVIVAKDVLTDPALAEFKVGYLDVLNIKSMLDIPFFLDGKLGGVICCEHCHEVKDWTEEDVDFGKSISDLITIAFKSAQMKTLLEESRQRTEELHAQEEEMRQNMEEMLALQEELARSKEEIEEVRKIEKERADNQIISQKKLMETVVAKYKSTEAAYKQRIEELEKLQNA